MPESDDHQWLAEYARHGSHEAFGLLVKKYSALVYSAAFRRVRDRQMAEEIAQAVFILLARKASQIHPRVVLAGWLYRTTLHASYKAIRSEARRKRWETEAALMKEESQTDQDLWPEIEPLLEQAMESLSETDRNAILLRYFQNLPISEIAGQFRISEAAVKMRLVRATEKLRRRLGKGKAAIPAPALAILLSARAADAAIPEIVAASIESAVMTGIVAKPPAAAILAELVKGIFMKKAATLILGIGTILSLFYYRGELAAFHTESRQLAEASEKLAEARRDFEKKSSSLEAQTRAMAALRVEPAPARQPITSDFLKPDEILDLTLETAIAHEELFRKWNLSAMERREVKDLLLKRNVLLAEIRKKVAEAAVHRFGTFALLKSRLSLDELNALKVEQKSIADRLGPERAADLAKWEARLLADHEAESLELLLRQSGAGLTATESDQLRESLLHARLEARVPIASLLADDEELEPQMASSSRVIELAEFLSRSAGNLDRWKAELNGAWENILRSPPALSRLQKETLAAEWMRRRNRMLDSFAQLSR